MENTALEYGIFRKRFKYKTLLNSPAFKGKVPAMGSQLILMNTDCLKLILQSKFLNINFHLYGSKKILSIIDMIKAINTIVKLAFLIDSVTPEISIF